MILKLSLVLIMILKRTLNLPYVEFINPNSTILMGLNISLVLIMILKMILKFSYVRMEFQKQKSVKYAKGGLTRLECCMLREDSQD